MTRELKKSLGNRGVPELEALFGLDRDWDDERVRREIVGPAD